MARGGGRQSAPPAVALPEAGGDSQQHPGTAQVQPVDVRKLRVRAVGDDAGREPGGIAVARDARQEAREPGRKFSARQHPAHEVRFRQAGRQEILARRLVIERAVLVGQVVAAAALVDERQHGSVPRHHRPVADQAEGERGLRVLADAYRVAQFRQPRAHAIRSLRLQRTQDLRPPRGFRIGPGTQLGGELQQPREPIGPLEGRPPGTAQVGELDRDFFRREARAQRRPRRRCEPRLRIQACQSRQQPVAVHGRMPVEAAEEHRRQLARRPHVRVAAEHVRDLVRVLEVRAVERELREAPGGGFIERDRRRLRGSGGRDSQCEEGQQAHRPPL